MNSTSTLVAALKQNQKKTIGLTSQAQRQHKSRTKNKPLSLKEFKLTMISSVRPNQRQNQLMTSLISLENKSQLQRQIKIISLILIRMTRTMILSSTQTQRKVTIMIFSLKPRTKTTTTMTQNFYLVGTATKKK